MIERSYDPTIGPASLDAVDPIKVRRSVCINKTIVDPYLSLSPSDVILVAGAGDGTEAIAVHEAFGARTVAVDLNIDETKGSPTADVVLQRQDLTRLSFPSEAFQFSYCNHVLEHVTDHLQVLRELHRVLRPGGVLYIGFPNRHRLVAYVGCQVHASFWDRVRWNLDDWRLRLTGGFENQLGAHAGFTQQQFLTDSRELFKAVRPVRRQYMLLKYPSWMRMISVLTALGLDEYVFPSNYFVCVK